jgi:hypothetical protein
MALERLQALEVSCIPDIANEIGNVFLAVLEIEPNLGANER